MSGTLNGASRTPLLSASMPRPLFWNGLSSSTIRTQQERRTRDRFPSRESWPCIRSGRERRYYATRRPLDFLKLQQTLWPSPPRCMTRARKRRAGNAPSRLRGTPRRTVSPVRSPRPAGRSIQAILDGYRHEVRLAPMGGAERRIQGAGRTIWRDLSLRICVAAHHGASSAGDRNARLRRRPALFARITRPSGRATLRAAGEVLGPVGSSVVGSAATRGGSARVT